MAISTNYYPAQGNTYIPSYEASGKLQVEFSRNPKKFSLPKYCRYKNVEKHLGVYLTINTENNRRLQNSNLADYVWPRGQEAITGDANKQAFKYDPYYCNRYNYPFMIDRDSVDQAPWDVKAAHARMAAQLAMTARTQIAVTNLTTTGNWGANTDTCTNVAGGQLAASSTTTLYIKSLFQNVGIRILKATGGVVVQSDLIAVMNPTSAAILAKSPELVQHLIQSPFAMGQIRGDFEGNQQYASYGLPDILYGITVVVENAVKTTNDKGAATVVNDFIFPDDQILFVSRPGGLTGSEGVPDFSTVQLFLKEDMTVETMDDTNNRRVAGRVVDDFDARVVAPLSGFLVTDCFA